VRALVLGDLGRMRLKSLDQIRVGRTEIVLRVAAPLAAPSTADAEVLNRVDLSPAQHRVLVALCRPYEKAASSSSPATNKQIADQLSLSIPAVKTHLRALFLRFGIGDLPQNEKRTQLAKLALASGTVSLSDLRRE
jgi:DNA-binding CsgD family transcriptional regulator